MSWSEPHSEEYMQVQCFTDASGFDKLRSEWDDLVHRSITDSVFLTWDWQTVWWRNLGTGTPLIISVREDDGRLVGILPLFWDAAPDGKPPSDGSTGNTLSLIGCVDVSDYLDAIVEKGKEPAVYPAFVDTLLRPELSWDHLQCCTLPAASPTNALLRQAAQDRGLAVDWHLHDVSPVIELPPTWEEYLGQLDKKQRHEIRRKLRRLEEAGGRWQVQRTGDGMNTAVAQFIDLHKKSQPDKHLFMDARMQQFFVEMAQTLDRHQWVQIEFVEVNGVRAAALFNFVYADRVLVYNSGFDPSQFAPLSPGVALFALSIRNAIGEKRRAYDFLRGDEDYKYRFGAKNTEIYELHIKR